MKELKKFSLSKKVWEKFRAILSTGPLPGFLSLHTREASMSRTQAKSCRLQPSRLWPSHWLSMVRWRRSGWKRKLQAWIRIPFRSLSAYFFSLYCSLSQLIRNINKYASRSTTRSITHMKCAQSLSIMSSTSEMRWNKHRETMTSM